MPCGKVVSAAPRAPARPDAQQHRPHSTDLLLLPVAGAATLLLLLPCLPSHFHSCCLLACLLLLLLRRDPKRPRRRRRDRLCSGRHSRPATGTCLCGVGVGLVGVRWVSGTRRALVAQVQGAPASAGRQAGFPPFLRQQVQSKLLVPLVVGRRVCGARPQPSGWAASIDPPQPPNWSLIGQWHAGRPFGATPSAQSPLCLPEPHTHAHRSRWASRPTKKAAARKQQKGATHKTDGNRARVVGRFWGDRGVGGGDL